MMWSRLGSRAPATALSATPRAVCRINRINSNTRIGNIARGVVVRWASTVAAAATSGPPPPAGSKPAGTFAGSGQSNFEITVLGSGASKPNLRRGVPSIAVRLAGTIYLFDCGEGTQLQMMKAGLNVGEIRKIFITHMHGDHVYGLPGLISNVCSSFASTEEAEANGHRPPPSDPAHAIAASADERVLDIYGPIGLTAFIQNNFISTSTVVAAPHMLRFHELVPNNYGLQARRGGGGGPFADSAGAEPVRTADAERTHARAVADLRKQHPHINYITAAWHSPYDVLDRQPFEFLRRDLNGSDRNRGSGSAAANGKPPVHCHKLVDGHWGQRERMVPNVYAAPVYHRVPCWGYTLHEPTRVGGLDTNKLAAFGIGEGVLRGHLKSGRTVTSPKTGESVAPEQVLTAPRRGRKMTIIYDTNDSSPMAPVAMDSDLLFHESTFLGDQMDRVRATGHSTAAMAGSFARDIRAKHLVLTHISGRYADFDPLMQQMIAEAKHAAGHERVILAEDLQQIALQPHKSPLPHTPPAPPPNLPPSESPFP